MILQSSNYLLSQNYQKSLNLLSARFGLHLSFLARFLRLMNNRVPFLLLHLMRSFSPLFSVFLILINLSFACRFHSLLDRDCCGLTSFFGFEDRIRYDLLMLVFLIFTDIDQRSLFNLLFFKLS